MLGAKNITKVFGVKRVLERLELPEVKNGDLVVISGSNGAGKTTLVRILSGVLLPDDGAVFYAGQVVAPFSSLRQRLANEMGVVFSDEKSFYPHLSGGENVIFFEGLYDKKRGDLFFEAQKKLDAECFMNVGFDVLSKGMKQKMCFLRALIGEPSIIVMDELDALDSKSLKTIDEILESFVSNGGAVIKFTSKNTAPLEIFSHNIRMRCYHLSDGKLIGKL